MTYFSGYLRHKRHVTAFTLLLALAITAAVAGIVFLAANRKLSPGLRDSHIGLYSLIACGVFTVWALVLLFTKRFAVHIFHDDNRTLTVEVKDPALLGPLTVRGPLILHKQWTLVNLGRRNKIKMLYITLADPDGMPLLTFTGGLGNFYDAPDGFEHAHPEGIRSAERVYESNKIQDIAHAFWSYEDFMALERKSGRTT